MLTSKIAEILLDNGWHSTTQIAILVRDFIRPEVAWRRAYSGPNTQRGRSLFQGYRGYTLLYLCKWAKIKKIEKRTINGHSEWRASDIDWLKERILKEEEK